jgi:hypothetical protein
MRKLLTLVDANPGVDPRYWFGIAWVAAFLGFVLIIGTVAMALVVLSPPV